MGGTGAAFTSYPVPVKPNQELSNSFAVCVGLHWGCPLNRNEVEYSLRVEDESLPHAEKFKYLGILFTSDINVRFCYSCLCGPIKSSVFLKTHHMHDICLLHKKYYVNWCKNYFCVIQLLKKINKMCDKMHEKWQSLELFESMSFELCSLQMSGLNLVDRLIL